MEMRFNRSHICFLIAACALSAPGPRPVMAQETRSSAEELQLSNEIEALKKEMKEKPGDGAAMRLGHLLLKKGDPEGAMQAFDEALRINPRSFEARTGKGIALGRRGETGEAEKVLREALVLNPNPARVHYELGIIYEKRGDFARAIAEYREGVKDQEGKGDYN